MAYLLSGLFGAKFVRNVLQYQQSGLGDVRVESGAEYGNVVFEAKWRTAAVAPGFMPSVVRKHAKWAPDKLIVAGLRQPNTGWRWWIGGLDEACREVSQDEMAETVRRAENEAA
jgi:hypothetical protein